MEGSHHIDPVVHLNFGPAMNLNFQLNKREREQEDAELLMPDCRPKKQQRLSK
jgi:hypothetical protein